MAAEFGDTAGLDEEAALMLDAIWEEKWFGIIPTTVSSKIRDDDALRSSSVSRSSSLLAPSFFSEPSFPYDPAYQIPRLPVSKISEPVIAALPQPASHRVPDATDNSAEPKFELGTWTQRQRRLMADAATSKEGASTTTEEAARALRAFTAADETTPGSLITAGLRQQQVAREKEAAAKVHGDDEIVDAAWRWRFARRWHAEQVREIDPEEDTTADDKTEEALQFLKAGGGNGWNMQLRTTRSSRDNMASLMNSLNRNGSLRGLDSELLSELAANDIEFGGESSSVANRGAPPPLMAATQELSALHRRAEQLAHQQQDLERQALERWNRAMTGADNTNGEAWVSPSIPSIDVDDWGTFKFVVVRMSDQAGHERLVVHGKNGCVEAAIVDQIKAKLVNNQGVSLLVMGGGVMNWTQRGAKDETNKHVHLHSAHSADLSVLKPNDLLSLASALIRQGFPSTYAVTTG